MHLATVSLILEEFILFFNQSRHLSWDENRPKFPFYFAYGKR